MPFGIFRGKHERLREQLSAYLDDELSAPERFEMEHHLEFCPQCRGELDELRTIASATSLLPEIPVSHSYALTPEMLEISAVPRSPAAAEGGATNRPLWYLVGWAAAGVAALLLGAGVAHMLTRDTGPAEPPVRALATPTPIRLTATAVPAVLATATATVTTTPTTAPADSPTQAPASRPPPVALNNGGSQSFTPVASAGQPGGTVTVPLPSREGAPIATAVSAATPLATAPGAVVAAPPTRANPAAPVAAAAPVSGAVVPAAGALVTGAAAPVAAAPASVGSAAVVSGAPVVIGQNAGAPTLLVPPANRPAAAALAPLSPTTTPTRTP